MSQYEISVAFDKAIVDMPNGLGKSKTAFENLSVKFAADQPYQVLRLIPGEVENPTLGDNYHREVGIYQVILKYPLNKGTGDAREQAEFIKAYFNRGKTLVYGQTEVTVQNTPTIEAPYIDDNRYCIPIRIRYYSSQT